VRDIPGLHLSLDRFHGCGVGPSQAIESEKKKVEKRAVFALKVAIFGPKSLAKAR